MRTPAWQQSAEWKRTIDGIPAAAEIEVFGEVAVAADRAHLATQIEDLMRFGGLATYSEAIDDVVTLLRDTP